MELTQMQKDLITLLKISGVDQETTVAIMLITDGSPEAMIHLIRYILDENPGKNEIVYKIAEMAQVPKKK